MIRKFAKKLNAVLLVICIIAVQFTLPASAVEYPVFAKIKQSKGVGYTPVRSLPGLNSNPNSVTIENIYDNETVRVLGEANDPDGDMWYKIEYGNNFEKQGYVFNTHVILIGNYVEDPQFEESIKDFPESYKVKLRNLHALYPKWVFYADHINLEWSDVIAAESEIKRKLVHISKPDSWKSMEQGAYDSTTGTWYQFDTGYVQASKTVIEYHTDPRNFLDSKNIFMFSSHSYDSKYDTKENLMSMIGGTWLDAQLQDAPGRTYSDAILSAASKANVSPFIIASTIFQEQGSGTAMPDNIQISGTHSTYPNIYNYFNIGASDGDGALNALKYAAEENPNDGRPWNTREKSIECGAEWYAKGYVSVGQNTYYYMNFDVIEQGGYYWHQYATNLEDTVQKTKFLAKAYESVMESALVFHIPVYNNMPEYTSLPGEGNNNNYLKYIEIEGCSPINYDKYTLSYETFLLDANQSSVNIVAVPESGDATIVGAGQRQINIGHNEIQIVVRASSGETRTYTIDIYRNASVPPPAINGKYNVGSFITGVNPETSVSDFVKNLGVENGTAKVFSSSNTQKTSGNIASGDIVRIYDFLGTEHINYNIVIYGDINSDGKISLVDLSVIKMNLLGIRDLSGAAAIAADTNKDEKITLVDLSVIKRVLLNLITIKQ